MTVPQTVLKALVDMDEPLTRIEISAITGVLPTTLQTALSALVKSGSLYARSETSEERALRLGGDNQAGVPANLYATFFPVPPRTMPALCDGTMTNPAKRQTVEAAPVDPITAFLNERGNVNERTEKLALVRDSVTHTLRNANQVAAAAGCSEAFARDVLNVLVEIGEVEAIKRQGKRGMHFRLASVMAPEKPATAAAPAAPSVNPTPESRITVEDADTLQVILARVTDLIPTALREELAAERQKSQALEAKLTALRNALAV